MPSKKQGSRTPSSRRGQSYGSKRGTPDIQVAKARRRQEQGRIQESAAQVQASQARLARRMAREAVSPSMGAAAGAQYGALTRQMLAPAPPAAPPPAKRALLKMPPDRPWYGEPKPGFSVWDARRQVREGYRVEAVIARTGVGMQYLADLDLDEDGRGVQPVTLVEAEPEGPDPEMVAYAQKLVKSWPALTPEQRAQLRVLLS